MILRDYQQEMMDRLEEAWTRHRSVMVQMPTGTGKTRLMAEVIRKTLPQPLLATHPQPLSGREGGGVLVVAHRRELVEQIRKSLPPTLPTTLPRPLSDSEGSDVQPLVVVESIQKITRKDSPPAYLCERGKWKPSLIIVDEAHHAVAKTYRKLWEWWPEAKFLGLTATPCRLSGEAFTDLFDTLLQSWSIRTFIGKGWLSDLNYISVRSDSVALRKVAALNKRGADGDYQTKEMATVLDVPESIEHLYRSYSHYADGKKGIVYAINREHARHIADYYQKHGVRCAVIDAKTPAEERRRLVEAYRSTCRTVDVLVNVDIFSEGFDVPEVEFIQLARPTLSLAKYLQQVGRGMRISKGKKAVTILDQVGLYLLFGLPTSDRNWTAMFQGRLTGKGAAIQVQSGTARGLGEDKVLVNEEMVQIHAVVGEKAPSHAAGNQAEGEGQDRQAEIFTANGMSDIMNDGKPGEYVGQEDGVFEYRRKEHGRMVTYLYDAKSHETFADMRLKRMGGMLFFRSCHDGSYILRGQADYRKAFRRDDVVYNDCIAIIGDDLFVKNDGNRRYQIAGYHGDSIIVRTNNRLAEIRKDGSRGMTLKDMPADMTGEPDFLLLDLQREALTAATAWGAGQQLRDYQREMLDQYWNCGRRRKRVLLQTPTGAGKTWIAMPVIQEEIKMNSDTRLAQAKKVLIVTHREDMVAQIAETLERGAIKARVMTPDFFSYWCTPDVTICTTTSVMDHLNSIHRDYIPTLMVFDEAHLIPEKVYHKLFLKWPNAKCLGLTATPMGENGLVLNRVFSLFVPSRSIRRLTDEGWLKVIEYVHEGPETYQDVEQLCQTYMKHANGRRGIVCATSQRHAQQIADCYNRHNVKAAVCKDLTTREGRQQLENLHNGNLKVLVEVNQLSDGFRCPDIDFIQLACPTRLLTTYLHQVGCGMARRTRTDNSTQSQAQHALSADDRLIVLDHVGAKDRFGLPTDDRDWNRMFAEGMSEKGVKKTMWMTAVKKKEPAAISPTATKWQLRMQRLLDDAPNSQT